MSQPFSSVRALRAFCVLAALFVLATISLAQTAAPNIVAVKQFRSIATGSWNSTTTWEESTNGGGSWSPATTTPSSLDGAVTIRAGHNVTAPGNSSPTLTIDAGATLTLGSDLNFTTPGAVLTINGTLTGGRILMGQNTMTQSFAGTGSYSNGGRLELYNGVTVNVAADTTMTSTDATNNSLLQVDGGTNTLNLASIMDVTAPSSGTNYASVFIAGAATGPGFRSHGNILFNANPINIPVEIVDGTAKAQGVFNGPLIVDGGATVKTAGTNLYGDLNVMTSGTLDLTGNDLNFNGDNHSITINGSLVSSAGSARMLVQAPSGTVSFSGNGQYGGNTRIETYQNVTLNVAAGTTMNINAPAGTGSSNLQIDGGTTFNLAGAFNFNAPSAPADFAYLYIAGNVTGTGPLKTSGAVTWATGSSNIAVPIEIVSGVQNGGGNFNSGFTVDSGATFKATSGTSWSGDLTIASGGTLDLAGGSVAFTGDGKTLTISGSLTNSVGTVVFYLTSSAPTPATHHIGTSPGTVDNSITFEVYNSGTVMLDGDAQLSNLQVDGGYTFDLKGHTLKLSGNRANGTSPLYIGGTFVTTGSTIEFNGTSAQTMTNFGVTYNSVTINNSAGVTMDGPVTIPGTATLTLTKGILGNGANLTLGNGTTIVRDTGSLGAVPTFGSTVNVTYTGVTPVTSGAEIPSSSSVLSNLTFNKGVTMGSTATVNGILTLNGGVVVTSAANRIIVATASQTAIAGGSSSAYISGPLSRAVASGGTWSFPIGKGSYNPFDLVNPTVAGPGIVTAEVFDGATGGTAGQYIQSMNSNHFWAASISGGTISGAVRLTDPTVVAGQKVAQSATQTGTYSKIGGTVSGSTITSDPTTGLGYFVIVTPQPPSVQFSSATYVDDESQSATVTVTRTGDTSDVSSVSYQTVATGSAVGGASCTAGVDYISTSGTLNFAASDTSKSFSVSLCADMVIDPNETFDVTLSSPSGAVIGAPSTATVTINDTAAEFRNSTPITIDQGAAATPYPSDITVSGFSGFLGSVRVTLFDVSHNLPDNMQFLLVSPTGSSYVLAADVGGAIPVDPAAPVTLTFSDGASTILPDNGPLATGTFLPTSCGTVQTFPLPAPQVGYFTPPCQVARTVGQRMRDAFGGGLANGTWHLYVYDDNGAAAPAAPVGLIAGGWGLQPLSTTAATVSVSGRVLTSAGTPVRGAAVTLTGVDGSDRTVKTNAFGYYVFDDVQSGANYVLGATARQRTFSPRMLHVVDSLAEVDLTSQE